VEFQQQRRLRARLGRKTNDPFVLSSDRPGSGWAVTAAVALARYVLNGRFLGVDEDLELAVGGDDHRL